MSTNLNLHKWEFDFRARRLTGVRSNSSPNIPLPVLTVFHYP